MIDMELLSVIRRWHHRDHIPIREIGRRTGLSRNTIRKCLRLDAVEVGSKVPERRSRLDPFGRQAVGVAAGGGGQGTQGAPDGEADPRGPGRPGL